jgi:lipoprotein-releasing system permease protein
MSRLPIELLLALRYLRPKRTFISVITLISVLGVALGVAVLIIVISVMTGFGEQLRETILNVSPHLRVGGAQPALTNYAAVISRIASNPNVKGVAPAIRGPVLVETQREGEPPRYWAPNIQGIDPQYETNLSILPAQMAAGSFDVSGRGILVGTALAQRLDLMVGDRINIYAPRDIKKVRESQQKGEEKGVLPDEYEVRGIFDAGWEEINASIVLVSLENAQDMFDLDDAVHELTVMLHDPMRASQVRKELWEALGPGCGISTWLENSKLLSAVFVEKSVMLYTLFFIIIVAAFGITCTLITFIVMKTREIGLMKAVGATDRQVMWVFLGQSLIVSLAGIVLGPTLGLLAVHYRNEFLGLMRRLTGMELFPAEIYGFTQLPAKVIVSDVAIICGGSLLICLLAAALPARHASKMNPVEALRYE